MCGHSYCFSMAEENAWALRILSTVLKHVYVESS